MTPLLLHSYKLEYEAGNISIEQLCKKYNVTTEQLTWYEPPQVEKPIVIPESPIKQAKKIDLSPQKDSTTTALDPTLVEDIATFKRLAVNYALDFMANNSAYADVKEFKDVVSVIDSIDKSLKNAPDSSTTVNVMVQNIMQGFSDDC